MLIAQIYMHLAMGLPLNCQLGFSTIARRRLCQRAGGAAADGASTSSAGAAASGEGRAEPQCGLVQHAGRHASVFDAAVCTFARQRLQREDAEAEARTAAGIGRLVVGGSPPATCFAPASPLAHAPTPPNANTAAAQLAAPAVQPTVRVRHFGIGKRVGSRRTLFDMVGGAGGDAKQLQQQVGEASGSKSPSDGMALPPQQLACSAAAVDVLAGSVSLEMAMSPRHASVQALLVQQQLAAAVPNPASWEGRKRLCFD